MIAISEFAIIISSLAVEYGFASKEILTISVLVVIISSLLASLASSNSEFLSERIVGLVPRNFKIFVENYVSPFFERVFNPSNDRKLEKLRKIVKELLIVISFIFLISFLVTYFINYLNTYRTFLGNLYLILIGSFLLSIFAIVVLEFYLIFRKLLDFLVEEFEETIKIRKNQYRYRKISNFKLLDLSLSLRNLILIVFALLTIFVILCYYFLHCEIFDRIENFLDIIFLLSVLIALSAVFTIFLNRLFKKIRELLE